MTIILIILAILGSWIFWYYIGKNNPSIPAVNKLISAGKAVINKAGQIEQAVKKVI